MSSNYFIVIPILLIGAIVSVKTGKLTIIAGLTGFIVGLLVFQGGGYTGIAMLATFFVLGTMATSWGLNQKQQSGLAEKNKGKRTAGQVIANAGVPGILGLFVILNPAYIQLLQLMMATAFASATADTLSSELGNLYGKNFYNILTFKKDTRGLDGVVSVEGTLAGVAGSICIAIVFATGFGFNAAIVFIIIAGNVGNLVDSILGATLERKHYLNNNSVNFLNTAGAALVGMCIYLINEHL